MAYNNRTHTKVKALRQYLKRIPLLVTARRFGFGVASKMFPKFLDGDRGSTKLNIVRSFRLYVPNSAGKYQDRASLAIQTINQTFPALSLLAASTGAKQLEVIPVQRFPKSPEERVAAGELKVLLDKYHSDKANLHDYHHLYGSILWQRDHVTGVLEIGLGTNNTDVVSTMGALGKPGASLRAFRDFFENARVYGADIDTRVLFQENRIETFFVDQTKSSTFDDLARLIPCDLDLIIDDGLHSPDANLITLRFALKNVRAGGWVVIEDIRPEAIPVWEVVSSLLPESSYDRYLLSAAGGHLFAIKRLV